MSYGCDCHTCLFWFQLIEGSSAQQKEALGIMTPDYYTYLNQSGTYKVDGTNDSSDFQETMVRRSSRTIMKDSDIGETFHED